MVESTRIKPPLIGLYIRNYAANLSGNFIIVVLNFFTPLAVFEDWRAFHSEGGWVMVPIVIISLFLIATLLQYLVQRPISALLKKIQNGEKPEAELQEKARRRLLNLPFIIALVNVTMWIAFTALLMPIMYLLINMPVSIFFYGFFRLVMIGMIASFISFFLIDAGLRKRLVPMFFPEGKLAAERGTIKISILRRIRVLFGVGTNAPMVLLVGTLAFAVWEIQDANISAGDFGIQLLFFTIVLGVIFVVVSLSLNFLSGKSILKPIKEMMRVVDKVRDGDFYQKVRVVSNDELGMLGDGMNEMTEGLIERDRMRRSLNLAKEVQQALLPRAAPIIEGLDIAAQTVYCDETGGDYYDFIGSAEPEADKLNVIIGDVSGHGIPSALLMATGRALLRQRTVLSGSISKIVTEVNHQLCRDFEEPGGFMTLFYLEIDRYKKCLKWVRAGHDPAIFYNPQSEQIEDLLGEGMALGVDENHEYLEYTKHGLAPGQIIVLGTDGIWETHNSRGEMYGKDHLFRIIRQYSDVDAKGLLTACLYNLEKFRDGLAPEDDVTLIVIKITEN